MDGIRAGMAVKDAEGRALGKVHRVYPSGFEVVRGFWSPYQWVFRYDEVSRVSGGVVEVARAKDDLLRLAAGELPTSWRRVTPPFGSAPVPAAPGESAGGRIADAPPRASRAPAPAADEEREPVASRGPTGAPAHSHP